MNVMKIAFTKKLHVAAIAGGLSLLAAGQAAADTYSVIVNATGKTISVGGAQVAHGEGAWSPLDTPMVVSDGRIAEIKDMKVQCADGGWLLHANAPGVPSTMCIKLGFAEVGCILASVTVNKQLNAEVITMTKARAGVCADRWWETAGKDIIRETADRLITIQGNVLPVLSSIAGG
jgi:hypothetical protein